MTILVQCHSCKKKVLGIDLDYFDIFDKNRICFDCRKKKMDEIIHKKCTYKDCNKCVWIEETGKNEGIIHNFCKEHELKLKKESDEVIKELEKKWKMI